MQDAEHAELDKLKLRPTAFAWEVNADLQEWNLPPLHIMLARLAAGQDCRTPNQLVDLIMEADKKGITDERWDAIIKEASTDSNTHQRVDLETAIDALKTLMKYAHAVPKDVIKVNGTLTTAVVPLTLDEIDKFTKWVNDEF